jgi:hypothetical protein
VDVKSVSKESTQKRTGKRRKIDKRRAVGILQLAVHIILLNIFFAIFNTALNVRMLQSLSSITQQ